MEREEAIKYLISPVATTTAIGEEKLKEFEAYNMAIEALSREQKEYDAICDELLELKSDLMLPIEVAMAVVMKYAKRGGSK